MKKDWKVLRDCLKNLLTGIPLGHYTFPWGCTPQENLMTLGNSLRQFFPDNSYGLSNVCTMLCVEHLGPAIYDIYKNAHVNYAESISPASNVK